MIGQTSKKRRKKKQKQPTSQTPAMDCEKQWI